MTKELDLPALIAQAREHVRLNPPTQGDKDEHAISWVLGNLNISANHQTTREVVEREYYKMKAENGIPALRPASLAQMEAWLDMDGFSVPWQCDAVRYILQLERELKAANTRRGQLDEDLELAHGHITNYAAKIAELQREQAELRKIFDPDGLLDHGELVSLAKDAEHALDKLSDVMKLEDANRALQREVAALRGALITAQNQIEYMQEKFQATGSGNQVLAQIREAIDAARDRDGGKDAPSSCAAQSEEGK